MNGMTTFASKFAGLITDVKVGKKTELIRFVNGVYSTDNAEIIPQLLKKKDMWEIKDDESLIKTTQRHKIVSRVATDTAGGVLGNISEEEENDILQKRRKEK
jgi:hypothetical protein